MLGLARSRRMCHTCGIQCDCYKPISGGMVGERSHARFLSAGYKTPRNQDKGLVTSVSSKHGIMLLCPSQVSGRIEFISDYSLQLDVVIYLNGKI